MLLSIIMNRGFTFSVFVMGLFVIQIEIINAESQAFASKLLLPKSNLIAQMMIKDLKEHSYIIDRNFMYSQVPVPGSWILWFVSKVAYLLQMLRLDGSDTKVLSYVVIHAIFVTCTLASLSLLLASRHTLSRKMITLGIGSFVLIGGSERWLIYLLQKWRIMSPPIYYREIWSDSGLAIRDGIFLGIPLIDAVAFPIRHVVNAMCILFLGLLSAFYRATSWRAETVILVIECVLIIGMHELSAILAYVCLLLLIGGILYKILAHSGLRKPARYTLSVALPVALGAFLSQKAQYSESPAWAYWNTRGDAVVNGYHLILLINIPIIVTVAIIWSILWRLGFLSVYDTSSRIVISTATACCISLASVSEFFGYGGLDLLATSSVLLAVMAGECLISLLRDSNSTTLSRWVAGGIIVVHAGGIIPIALEVDRIPNRKIYDDNFLKPLVSIIDERNDNPLVLVPDTILANALMLATNARIGTGLLTEYEGISQSLIKEWYDERGSVERREEIIRFLGVRFVVTNRYQQRYAADIKTVTHRGNVADWDIWEVVWPESVSFVPHRGQLLRNEFGDIYLFDGTYRRWIPNIEEFNKLQRQWADVDYIDCWTLSLIPEGYRIGR